MERGRLLLYSSKRLVSLEKYILFSLQCGALSDAEGNGSLLYLGHVERMADEIYAQSFCCGGAYVLSTRGQARWFLRSVVERKASEIVSKLARNGGVLFLF